jgi:hypothetical protein
MKQRLNLENVLNRRKEGTTAFLEKRKAVLLKIKQERTNWFSFLFKTHIV